MVADSSEGKTKAERRALAQARLAARQAFDDHNDRLRPLLPPAVRQLLDLPVHDAQIRSLAIDPVQRTLDMVWEYCDTPGCVAIHLRYSGITLTLTETSLLCYIAHDESAEVYWQEIDWEEKENAPPVFIQRILWQTNVRTGREPATGHAQVIYTLEPEMEMRFGGLEINVTPTKNDSGLRKGAVIAIAGGENNVNRQFVL